MSRRFQVLYVCTGNVCRSAAAAVMLRSLVPAGDPLVVASAGTGALEGYGIDEPTALVLREFGLDPAGHEGHWLDDDDVRAADLVLTATTVHRERVVLQVPIAMRRTFTMREFARLGADVAGAVDPDDRVRAVREVAGRRGVVEPAGPGEDDIGDPFGAGVPAARLALEQIGPTVRATARLLGLPTPG